MDYRRTKYCPELIDIKQKKKKIEAAIKTKYPRAKDMHTYIRNNSLKFKKDFIEAYNGKCAYCGVSIDLIKKNEFEIDHFIYEKAPTFATKKDAGYMDNLVLACHDCNHNKSAFWIDEEWIETLYPDGEKIKEVFFRDKLYYIRISDKYKEISMIKDFYYKLQLDSELHRLDYLIMNLIGLQQTCKENSELYIGLGKILYLIRKKRNII
ncbi:HNH endonuclease [Faecalicoccus acidiformans]|uniref:HNH endonuclease n=1 Tax=Faecalicoccus acidiformans TaxID=915173 RepID=A0ABS2FPA0_9FIRM|nr:HNH endonuclease [Faecalicoccus acidiformans]MBM6831851.1 HNH endonuclease [Faecalicoccus acidiformans]